MALIELKGGENRLWFDTVSGDISIGTGSGTSTTDPRYGKVVLKISEKALATDVTTSLALKADANAVVSSIKKSGSTALVGNVILVATGGTTLDQTAQTLTVNS